MKYWNKDREIRQRCWHHVTLDFKKISINNRSTFSHVMLKREFQLYPSKDKFYLDFYGAVSFSEKQDAVYFALRWA